MNPIELVDIDTNQRLVFYSVLIPNSMDNNSVVVGMYYDHDKEWGFQTVYDDNMNDLADHMPPEVVMYIWFTLDRALDIEGFHLRYLNTPGSEPHRIFNSSEPVDWDKIRKQRDEAKEYPH